MQQVEIETLESEPLMPEMEEIHRSDELEEIIRVAEEAAYSETEK